MTPDDLATLLDEANHAPWESVRSALEVAGDSPHPRAGWLRTHLGATKREYWALIAAAAGTPAPPDDAGLTRLMVWEVAAAHALPAAALNLPVQHAGQTLTVAELLRLNARHTAWHAGQLAALAGRTRGA